jgi:hypothetical protein
MGLFGCHHISEIHNFFIIADPIKDRITVTNM